MKAVAYQECESKLKTVCAFFKNGSCSKTLMNVLDRQFDHPMELEEHATHPLAGGLMQGYQCGMLWGAALAMVAVVPLLLVRLDRVQRVAVLAATTVMWFTLLHLAAVGAGGEAFDVRPVAEVLARAEAEGRPIAHVGPYHGQYHFYARLERPLLDLECAKVKLLRLVEPAEGDIDVG